MQIKDYTTPELEHFRAACNFTSLEREFFDLRAAGVTIAFFERILSKN